jgi:hypothetical protein
VYRLLRGHYSPVLAPTDSFVDPTRSPLLRSKPRSRSLCRLQPAPAAGGTFPTLSLGILPCVPGPLSRRSRGVHLPVSSSTSSAFPRTLSRSASRVSPSKRFHDGSPFRDCSHFVMLPGRNEARTGLRMMPTSPRSSLKSRTVSFPQYGFKAGVSGGAFPSSASSSRRAVCVRPSCTSLPVTSYPRSESRNAVRWCTSVQATIVALPQGPSLRSGL